jgi:competence protein ComEA
MRSLTLGLVALAVTALLGTQGAPALAAPPARPAESPAGVVNINTATAEQLQLLPTIGPARARAIVEYRKQHGAFKSVDELANVSGIGEAALEQLRPHCAVEGRNPSQPSE